MAWLIELIEKRQSLYTAVLTAIYIAILTYSYINYEFISQGAIFFIIPVILYAFVSLKAGMAIAGINVIVFLAATYSRDFSGISQHPFVWHFGGALVSFGVAYSFGSFKNMYSKQKRADGLIEESRAQYQKVVDTINEGMIILDTDGIVTFMNKAGADMLGVEVKNVGLSVYKLLDEENSNLFAAEMQRRKKGRPSEYHIYFHHPSGGRRHLFVAASPYVNEKGIVTGSIGFVNDFTDTDEHRLKIESLQRRNEYLIGEMHHRIGNSLSVVRAFLNLYLTDGSVGKEDGLRKVEDIINTMAFINNKFFMNFDRQTLNIGWLVKEAVSDLAAKYNFDNQRVRVEADNLEAHIDAALPLGMLLTIIFSNLMSRTFGTDFSLTITLKNFRDGAELTVSGNQAHIFHSDCMAKEMGSEGGIIEALLNQMNATCKPVGTEKKAMAIVF
ncbi:MAG TPA: PAS domain S-box protein [Clostridia bacterium]|nr:PAS domain S-box protein [Clostridia bacterium]